MTENLGLRVAATLRATAQAFAAGDQVAPCALLWPDPERLWEPVLPKMQALLPELFALGNYAPTERIGPGLWLRCLEARSIPGAPSPGVTPIFYLPGVSREQLRAVEDCPPELTALVELQFRGVLWLHVNGKEWTPYAYLVSERGGLGLEVARDQATLDALAGALPTLLDEPISHLKGRLLDAAYLNELVAPDASGLMLRWLNNPKEFQRRRSDAEWNAFCQQSKADFRFDPTKDGQLKAAKLLMGRPANQWSEAWQRFVESPDNYPGILEWLKRASSNSASLFESPECCPNTNERLERELHASLSPLVDRPQNEVAVAVAELESKHGDRRRFVWQKLGLSPLATVLEPLAKLAALCTQQLSASNAQELADAYSKVGWMADAAALETMAACDANFQHTEVLGVLRALYLPWLENSARQLQKFIAPPEYPPMSRRGAPVATAGRIVLFIDGLRIDVAKQLVQQLSTDGFETVDDWDWSTIPTVTATAKPAASPLAATTSGGEADEEFATRLMPSGQRMTQDRFLAALKAAGWQCLAPGETGDPSGWAWTEAGTLDTRGHAEGWKLARSVNSEVRELTSRISQLLKAGWREIMVTTDHGWLLVPGGLPKVELKSFLAEHRWGRCAALKAGTQTDMPQLSWHWNNAVSIASPPGAGCFRAGVEYCHGGVSLQEMVIPRLLVKAAPMIPKSANVTLASWRNATCRIALEGDLLGVRVDVRSVQSDPATSLLADQQSREPTAEGKVTVYLENESDIGKTADIVLLDKEGQVIDCIPTRLGESSYERTRSR